MTYTPMHSMATATTSALKEVIIPHLVKSEDLNHHGTLFAGRISEWMVEACFIAAARLVGHPEDVVCVQIHELTLLRPAKQGDIIELKTRIAHLGTKSIMVHGSAWINSTGTLDEETSVVSGMMTFVTVDTTGLAYAHGIALPDDYVKTHRKIYEQASALRKNRMECRSR